MTDEVDSRLNFGHDERRKLPPAERKKEKKENSLGNYKAGLPQSICGVELKKMVMSSCGGVITFHVDDCNSDKSERVKSFFSCKSG